jgi:hypothetical protein
MRIERFIWPEERIEHIARHGVTPREVEEACYGRALLLRGKSEGENPVYYVLGSDRRRPVFVLRGDPLSRRDRISGNRAGDDRQRKTPLPEVGRPMKKTKLPKTDSVQKLAEFWDGHDVTEFEDELEEVKAPVFTRGDAIEVPLKSRDIAAVERLARSKGVSREQLVRAWVLQRLARRTSSRPTKRSA